MKLFHLGPGGVCFLLIMALSIFGATQICVMFTFAPLIFGKLASRARSGPDWTRFDWRTSSGRKAQVWKAHCCQLQHRTCGTCLLLWYSLLSDCFQCLWFGVKWQGQACLHGLLHIIVFLHVWELRQIVICQHHMFQICSHACGSHFNQNITNMYSLIGISSTMNLYVHTMNTTTQVIFLTGLQGSSICHSVQTQPRGLAEGISFALIWQ